MDHVHSETLEFGITVNVDFDTDPVNPVEEYDMIGTMACMHRRYELGHVQPDNALSHMIDLLLENSPQDFESLCRLYRDKGESWDDCTYMRDYELFERIENNPDRFAEEFDKYFISAPLYLYDHSGLSISTGAFGCPWDSGQVGLIYIPKADARAEFGVKRITKTVLDRVHKALKSTVKSYDDYLTGQCFGFTIEDSDGDTLDSCWGFLGDSEYCLSEGLDLAKYHIEQARISQDTQMCIAARYLESTRPDMYRAQP